MALYVGDLKKARAFYTDFLGFQEPYTLKRDDGSDRIAFIKINEDQYLELFAEGPRPDGNLNHISFFTNSVEGIRAYLASNPSTTPPIMCAMKCPLSHPDPNTFSVAPTHPFNPIIIPPGCF